MIPGFICALIIGSGFPGLESRTDYIMDIRLEPDSSMLFGHSEILFTNGVDFPVDTLWLHLYPNAYRDISSAFGQDLEAVGRYYFRASPESEKGWIDLCGWSMNGNPVDISVDGCLGFISLDSPLDPGKTVLLQGDFIARNFDVSDPLEWIARVTSHIPRKGAKQVIYYGSYKPGMTWP